MDSERTADRPGADDPGRGRRLGIDVGAVRVGVALSDPAPMLASPLITLARDEKNGRDIDEIVALVAEHDVVEIVLGLPRTLAGKSGLAAQKATHYADQIAARVTVPVRLADERLTTVSATRMLSDRGVRGAKQRAVIDQVAAVEILQTWLDARSTA